MDKLQSALAKAREKRGEKGTDLSDAIRQPSRAKAPAPASPSATEWSGFASFTPDPAQLRHSRLVSLDANPDAMHFDILRTKTILAMRRHGWKRLAITSPTSLCGKTTTICNLAAGFARQRDVKTALFDLDLRRPAVNQVFGHRPEHGIREMLRGEVSFAEQAVCLGTNVAISMAISATADPTKYLLSDSTKEILDDIEAQYDPDLMLFDLPPLLVSDDARAFLKSVDCTILVAKAEETTASQIQTCHQEISEQTNVLGVVMTQCRQEEETGKYEYY